MTAALTPDAGWIALAVPVVVFAGLLFGLALLVEVVWPALVALARRFDLGRRLIHAAAFLITWPLVLADHMRAARRPTGGSGR